MLIIKSLSKKSKLNKHKAKQVKKPLFTALIWKKPLFTASMSKKPHIYPDQNIGLKPTHASKSEAEAKKTIKNKTH